MCSVLLPHGAVAFLVIVFWVFFGHQKLSFVDITVKPVLSGHSKKDETKILMTDGSLMKVKVLQNAPLGALCNTFDLH